MRTVHACISQAAGSGTGTRDSTTPPPGR
jgi:hypothetical protein